MNLRLFFTLPFHEDFVSYLSYSNTSMDSGFDKRYIFKNLFLIARVRIVNYNESFCHIYLVYKYALQDEIFSEHYLADFEFFNNKILIKNISNPLNIT